MYPDGSASADAAAPESSSEIGPEVLDSSSGSGDTAGDRSTASGSGSGYFDLLNDYITEYGIGHPDGYSGITEGAIWAKLVDLDSDGNFPSTFREIHLERVPVPNCPGNLFHFA